MATAKRPGERRRSSLEMIAQHLGMRRTSQISVDELKVRSFHISHACVPLTTQTTAAVQVMLAEEDDEAFLNKATMMLEDKHGSNSSRTKVTKVSR